ncbi:8-oxoguanine DNA glycosylase OGG fold protein [Rhodococcoides kroppenstedtii]|uniref:8-oxoguanine DNA glycosylase OGG fold protein n=1 Tax=Rhodococcoides kroppenstedtii TaxID=293050 RepID=UPI003645E66D
MRTDTESLELPAWLRDAPSDGFDTAIRINEKWWQKTLSNAGLDDEAPPSHDGRLKRSDIFSLASEGIGTARQARRVLWSSLAWGEGPRAFRNPGRVRSFLQDTARNSDNLVTALAASTSDPVDAYGRMNGHTKHLGPAFFTKALYFAGAGKPTHPSLILDARVAAALHKHCGWESLRIGGAWPADTYGRYCSLLGRWAQEMTTDGRPVNAEDLEYRLFMKR